MLSKNAIGNLNNRYKAVLAKCNLINVFGSLAVAMGLMLTPIMAENAHAVTTVDASGSVGTAGTGGTGGEGETNANGTTTNNGDDGTAGDATGDGGTGFGGALGGVAIGTANAGGGGGGKAEVTGASDGGEAIAFGGNGADATGANNPGSGGGGGTAIASQNANTVSSLPSGGMPPSAFAGYAQAYGGSAGNLAVGITTGNGNGGAGGTATANENTLNINASGTVLNLYGGNATAYGGRSQGNGTGGAGGTATASKNTLNINASVNAYASIYGGQATADGGLSQGDGTGGAGGTATANENTLTFDSAAATLHRAIYGGQATANGGNSSSGTGGDAGTATADRNTLNINVGTSTESYGGYAVAYGRNSNTARGGNGGIVQANENKLNISGGVVSTFAIGGYADSRNGTSIGGNGTARTATASNNIVTVDAANSVGSVYGGVAINCELDARGSTGEATAHGNKVIINGGTFASNKQIVGGVVLGFITTSTAHNNTVTLSGTPVLTDTSIHGGGLVDFNGTTNFDKASLTPYSQYFTGNTLNVERYTGTSRISAMGNFENYNFILPANTAANSTILQVTDLNLTDGGTQVASIGTVSIESGHNLQANDTITLIDSTNAITGTIANNGQIVTSDTSTFTQQEWEINQDTTTHNITATFISGKLAPSSNQTSAEIVANTQTGTGTATLGAAAQTLVTIVIPTAQMEAANALNKATASLEAHGMSAGSSSNVTNVWAPFAVMQGGYNSFDSGVDTDVTSLSFVGGIAYNAYLANSEFLLGAFVETGVGSYNSSAGTVDSDGNINYLGGGLFARYELYTQNGAPYFEASARMGNLNSDYSTNDIIDTTTGSGVSYETNSNYYGVHVGAGYIWNINNQWNLDMSAKYFWTHQESIDKEIAGDRFNFDSIDSHIARVGAVASYHMLNDEAFAFSPYIGLHYEHEFDSEARASVNNISIPNSASLEGGTTVLSLGATYSHINGFSLNGRLEGSLGKRDGINGIVEVRYTF